MSNLADSLAAAGFPMTKFQFVDCEDAMDCAHSLMLAESLLRHLGQDEDAKRLYDLAQALGLYRFIEKLSPEANQLVTVMLQAESKKRYQREREA